MTTQFFPFNVRNATRLSWLLLFLLWGFAASAQLSVSGVVTDQETGDPLIGVSISVKGKTVGTVTDIDGAFQLTIQSAPPITLMFSYTGFKTVELEVTESRSDIEVTLEPSAVLTSEVVISASRVEERILESPVTIEKMDPIAIKQTAAPDFYDGISNLKGVQTIQGSMTLTSINTRGFGAVANERFVQLIDWMDNSAPLFNFPTGNIVGISELDVNSVELVPGAASALYGPNAFNGILIMTSKSPFQHQGLSVQTKLGITSSDAGGSNPYYQVSARYAKAFGNRFAFKLNASYLTATDWVANDYTSGRPTAGNLNPAGPGNPNFDGMNLYGDETQILVPMAAVAPALSQALAPLFAQRLNISQQQAQTLLLQNIPKLPTLDLRRTGFKEEDLLESNDAKSIKLDGSLHYRLTDNLEASYSYRFGSGSTVYQGGERYVLRDFTQQFHKFELSNPNFFLRAYMSQTDDGDSYNLSALGAFVNEGAAPSSTQWVPTYAGTYAGALLPIVLQGGTPNSDQLSAAHNAARAAADKNIPKPGTPEFETAVNKVRDGLFQKGGAGFIDDSKLMHAEVGYNFTEIANILDLQIGGNYRQYNLFSDGTIFNEDPEGDGKNERIKINEYGFYAQIGKRLMDDRLKLSGSVRYDKNENFDGQFSPRFSVVFTGGAARQHNLRASFQTGFRNPSTQQQFIYFPTGAGILVGSTEANAARYGIHNGGAYTNQSYNAFIASVLARQPNPALLQEINISYVQPEQLRVIEFGYKGLIDNRILIDFNVYHNNYENFIAQQTVRNKVGTTHKGVALPGVQDLLAGRATSATAFRPYINATETVTSTGMGLGLTFRFGKGYDLYGHYNYSTFDVQNQTVGFEAGFNMPENKFLIGLGNRRVFKNAGFDINYRWQDEFEWQNSFAFGTIPSYGLLNAQVSYTIPSVKTTIKLGGTNMFGSDYRTNAGGPFVGQMYYVSLTFDQGQK